MLNSQLVFYVAVLNGINPVDDIAPEPLCIHWNNFFFNDGILDNLVTDVDISFTASLLR